MSVNNIHFSKIEIQLAIYIFKQYKNKYNARQLARLLHINHAHTNTLCRALVDKRLIVKQELGNSVFFSYNYTAPRAMRFMEYVLSLEPKNIPKWLAVLSHSLKKFEGHIELGILFGSSLQTKEYNDIDVLLMYSPKQSKLIKKIKDDIRKSGLIEKPIRYVDITDKDISKNKDDPIFYAILSQSLIFYNSEKYVEVIRTCLK